MADMEFVHGDMEVDMFFYWAEAVSSKLCEFLKLQFEANCYSVVPSIIWIPYGPKRFA